MRKEIPKLGDTRKRSGFLFFPMAINHERRWLEKATWIEKYCEILIGPRIREIWHPIEWVD